MKKNSHHLQKLKDNIQSEPANIVRQTLVMCVEIFSESMRPT
jgi:hypothetical protein